MSTWVRIPLRANFDRIIIIWAWTRKGHPKVRSANPGRGTGPPLPRRQGPSWASGARCGCHAGPFCRPPCSVSGAEEGPLLAHRGQGQVHGQGQGHLGRGRNGLKYFWWVGRSLSNWRTFIPSEKNPHGFTN